MPITLRQLFIGHAAVLSSLGLLASGSLVGLTTIMLHDGGRSAMATEGIRAASEIQVALLLREKESELFRLTRQPAHRQAAEEAGARLRRALAEATRYVDSAAERRVLDRLGREVGEYLASAAGSGPEPTDRAAAALLTSEDLITINATDAEASFERSRSLGRLAIVFGSSLAGLLLAIIGTVIAFARKWLYRPLTAIQAAIERLRAGEPGLLLQEAGPAELRDIAVAFNRTVGALAREREGRAGLLAALAHDLRNPLNALRITLYRVRPPGGPPPRPGAGDALAVVANQVDRLARMADDLLDMARMDAGRLELRLRATDLGVVAGECVELYRLVSDAHRLVLRVPDRPIVAVCDPDRLAQVLNNLIGNAIKYSADGGEVTVRLEHDGDDVVIAVADTGPGIDAAQAERIFDLFQRLADARGPIPGEGLGLWNARRILAAHGGTIRVRSTSGRGATFEVRLPGAAGGLPAPATAARATGSP